MTEKTDIRSRDEMAPLGRFRESVRAEKAYRVRAYPGIRTKLNQNESPFDIPEEIKAEILDEMRSEPFNRYPDDQPVALQNAIGASLGWDPDGILAGNGSNELTHTLGLCLASDGADVVLPRPLFALFASVVRLFGGRLTEVGPRPDLSFDADAIVAAVKAIDPALTVIATPNNPTGLEMTHVEVRSIVEAANGFVLIDEAYTEFGDEPDALALLNRHPNVIIMRTLSKGFGLAGMRIGYLVARPSVTAELLKARLPFMIGEFAQRTALRVLREPELIRKRVHEMQKSVAELYQGLEVRGLHPVPSKANFVLFKSPVPPSEFVKRLASMGVLTRDMSGYAELRDYVRVNAGTQHENKDFLDALDRILNH